MNTTKIIESFKNLGLQFGVDATVDIQCDLLPIPKEGEESFAYKKRLHTKESANDLGERLVADGFKLIWDTTMGHSMYRRYSKDNVHAHVYYEMSKEDKCAELKAQLAALGCHY